MGHFCVLAPELETALEKARAIRARLQARINPRCPKKQKGRFERTVPHDERKRRRPAVENQASAASFFARRLLRRSATFWWITPRLAARSKLRHQP